jgi:hypothetical protein
MPLQPPLVEAQERLDINVPSQGDCTTAKGGMHSMMLELIAKVGHDGVLWGQL